MLRVQGLVGLGSFMERCTWTWQGLSGTVLPQLRLFKQKLDSTHACPEPRTLKLQSVGWETHAIPASFHVQYATVEELQANLWDIEEFQYLKNVYGYLLYYSVSERRVS